MRIVGDRRPAGRTFKHSYGAASWAVLLPQAQPLEEWWSGADDASRFSVLRGLAIERRLKVVASERKSCPACGGSVRMDPSGPPGVCPACLGVTSPRVLLYP